MDSIWPETNFQSQILFIVFIYLFFGRWNWRSILAQELIHALL